MMECQASPRLPTGGPNSLPKWRGTSKAAGAWHEIVKGSHHERDARGSKPGYIQIYEAILEIVLTVFCQYIVLLLQYRDITML